MHRKVLVIEDNEKNRKLFLRIIQSMGYEVLAARNGEEGLRTAEEALPDLILTDIQMPNMDGITVLRKLRENPVTNSIPVIALTSYAMNDDRTNLLNAGFTHYISKPIDTQQFMREVRRFLGTE